MDASKKGSACSDMITATLKMFECNLQSTYDMSHVIVIDSSSSGHKVEGSGVYGKEIFYWDDEEEEKRLEHLEDFNSCYAEIHSILARFGCRIDTTYDMSRAVLIDKVGNNKNM